MKEKEIYLADLRSLKENISNKIMEAIQDLEAKNLKKIEKKIEKASQKIAMGLIKASLKNAELLTRKITNAIGPIHSTKGNVQGAPKKRGRPSLNTKKENLPGFESSTLKTILENNSKVLRKRGRPSKSSPAIESSEGNTPNLELSQDSPKKRGRPFGTKSKLLSSVGSVMSPKGRRGRPKLTQSKAIAQNLESTESIPLRKRGRPKLFSKTNSENSSSNIIPIKGRRGRPAKQKNVNPSDISSKESENNTSISVETSIPKTRGRKPKVSNPISDEKLEGKKGNTEE